MTRKVLLTGAGGRVGTAFREFVGDRYELRLVDRELAKIGNPGPYEAIQADLADLNAARAVCAGMDAVLHLAADPSPRADFYGSLLDNNIKAVYNIMAAAKEQGCRRVVYASSVQVIEGYPLDVQPKVTDPVKPMNLYAVTKAYAEALGHYFAYAEGLSNVAVRIGAFEGNRVHQDPDARTLSAFVSKRDLSHLFVQCIETENVQFAIVQAVSDNRFKRMDITNARETVGYAPVDDAFQLFATGLHDGDRWYQEYDRPKE